MVSVAGPLEEALTLLRAGDGSSGEKMLRERALGAGRVDGIGSPTWAAAWFDVAAYEVALGDLYRAIEACRQATGLVPFDAATVRNALSYRTNLGELLLQVGQVDEAARVLGAAAKERRLHFGAGHPGLAFGLLPLGEAQLAIGDLAAASQSADEAWKILAEVEHPHLARATALRAWVSHSRPDRAPETAFPDLETLDDPSFEELLGAVLARAGRRHDPVVTTAVLGDLQAGWSAVRGTDVGWTRLTAAWSNAAIAAGDHPARRTALSRLATTAADPAEKVDVLQAMAWAESDAGEAEAATATYHEAFDIAVENALLAPAADVARNLGVHLAEIHDDEAAMWFDRAIALADACGSEEASGRTRIAAGVADQHAGRLARAMSRLTDGLLALPETHRDAVVGRAHLTALRAGKPCGCDDMAEAVASLVREQIAPRIPADLVHDITWDDESGLHVSLARDLTDDEQALLERVLRDAMQSLRGSRG